MIEFVGMRKYNLGQRVIYTGETPDIDRRWHEHELQVHSNWAKTNGYRPCRLIYVESLPDCYSRDIAVLREKQLKRLSHDEKRSFAL